MRMKKTIASFFLSLFAIVMLTSAIPASEPKPVNPQALVTALNAAKADGKVTYKELKKIATDVKGSKLTLKERIGLKLFGKKIANKVPYSSEGKSQLIALILCGLIGGLGIHRFYLGYTWQGIVQLLTLGGCGIWSLIDFIRILTGSLQPKDGDYGTTL
jgi:hypothetical protein